MLFAVIVDGSFAGDGIDPMVVKGQTELSLRQIEAVDGGHFPALVCMETQIEADIFLKIMRIRPRRHAFCAGELRKGGKKGGAAAGRRFFAAKGREADGGEGAGHGDDPVGRI